MRPLEFLTLGFIALLTACNTVPSHTAPSIAAQARLIQLMSAEQLLAEQTRLAQGDGAYTTMLRALVRAAPNHPQRDETGAQQALERLADGDGGASRVDSREVAGLLALWLEERSRAEAALQQTQVRRLADERRAEQMESRTREVERRLQDAEKRVVDAERRAQEAERKLEALRAIEKEMSGRTPGNR